MQNPRNCNVFVIGTTDQIRLVNEASLRRFTNHKASNIIYVDFPNSEQRFHILGKFLKHLDTKYRISPPIYDETWGKLLRKLAAEAGGMT